MIKYTYRPIHIIFISCLIVISYLTVSCEKEPDLLGKDLLPGVDYFHVKLSTTTDIFGRTVVADSVQTSGSSVYSNAFGDEYNPFYGNTKAALLLNFFPDSVNHNFGTNPVCDSLVLYLLHDSVDKADRVPFEVNVYEVAKSIPYVAGKVYYSNISENEYRGSLLTTLNVTPSDTFLRIKISSSSLVNKLFNVPDNGANDSISAYQEYFKGLYLEARALNGKGVMLKTYPYTNYESKMIMYYRNPATSDTTLFTYHLSARTNRISKLSHNYQGTEIANALADNSFGQKIVYLQGMAGVNTRIRIPSLENWVDSFPAAINHAELQIPVYVQDSIKYGVYTKDYPSKLFLVGLRGDSTVNLADYDFSQIYIGGEYSSTNKVYTFNITRHLQKIVNSSKDNPWSKVKVENMDMMLIPGSNPVRNSKVALDLSPGKVKLSVKYSK